MSKEYRDLKEKIKTYSDSYHNDGVSLIGDGQYDELMKELRQLEHAWPELKTKDSPTQRVGGDVKKGFSKVTHPKPLLSLGNVFDAQELRAWCERVQEELDEDVEFTTELKIDGLAVALTYKGGRLVRGATRGNGKVGEDVTANVRAISGIPPTFDHEVQDLEVRGEVFMSKRVFEELNVKKEKNGEKLLANPRNAAAGALRQLDAEETRRRELSFIAYGFGDSTGFSERHSLVLMELAHLGFCTTNGATTGMQSTNVNEVVKFCELIALNRDSFTKEIDGVVVKVNSIEQQEVLGERSTVPRWAIAYKFPAREATTKLLGIDYQVGRTGVVKPVARMEPVEVGGVVISNATLHNEDYILNRDIRIGDTVTVKRAGDVIPAVVGPVVELRDGTEVVNKFPSVCQVCGTGIARPPGTADYVHIRGGCASQLVSSLQHFVSRKAMNIDGIGESVLQQLVDNDIVDRVSDLYRVTKEDLLTLDGFKDRKAQKFLDNIEASKNMPMQRLLIGLGIHHIGNTVSKVLVGLTPSLYDIQNLSAETLSSIDGFGDSIVTSITEWFNSSEGQNILDEFAALGLNMTRLPEEEPDQKKSGTKLNGLTFVLTGVFPVMSRNDAKELLESHGAKVSGSISKNTSYLVAGEKAGSKIKKANELGIKTISEYEMLDLVNK